MQRLCHGDLEDPQEPPTVKFAESATHKDVGDALRALNLDAPTVQAHLCTIKQIYSIASGQQEGKMSVMGTLQEHGLPQQKITLKSGSTKATQEALCECLTQPWAKYDQELCESVWNSSKSPVNKLLSTFEDLEVLTQPNENSIGLPELIEVIAQGAVNKQRGKPPFEMVNVSTDSKQSSSLWARLMKPLQH